MAQELEECHTLLVRGGSGQVEQWGGQGKVALSQVRLSAPESTANQRQDQWGFVVQ